MVGCQGVEVIQKKLWQNLKTQIVKKKPKNLKCDTTQKLKLWQNSITETETKHTNFKFDNSKTQIVTTQKENFYKTQKLKWRQNMKTQIVTKLKNPNCDKTKKNFNIDKTKKNQAVTKL